MYTLINRNFCWVFCILTNLLFINSLNADEDYQQVILKRIEQSKKDLSTLESQIGLESRKLAKNMSEQQQEVMKLRTLAADAQRIRDEQLLSLESIKNRVEKWEVQSVYQKHLLRAFVETTGLESSEVASPANSNSTLALAIDDLKKRLSPKWQSTEIVATSGEIFKASVLGIGPAELYVTQDASISDAIVRDSLGTANAAGVFTKDQSDLTQNLFEKGSGYFVFDPSLGSALKLKNQGDGMFKHVSKGGVWAIPILFFGLLSLCFAVIKGLHLWRLPKIDPFLFEKVQKQFSLSASGDGADLDKVNRFAQSRNYAQGELVKIATANKVSDHRDELLMAYLLEHRHKLDRFLGVVATSAAVAPLLGLLGTVSGMISTFKLMTIFGSGDASTVSGGISEALVTTELGLIVAIPSLIVSALLARTAKNYNHKLEAFAIKLSKLDFS